VKTDDLINLLARDVEPAKRGAWMAKLALVLIGGLALAIALMFAFDKIRPDIGAALGPVLMKAAFSAAAAAVALSVAMRLMQPGRSVGARLAGVGMFVGACVLVIIIALMGAPAEQRWANWMGRGFPWCLVYIPLLAAPTAAGLIWVARSLAPTRLKLSGAALGAIAGGIGAMAYAMYCPMDSVAFVTTWYAIAIGFCAAIGAAIGGIFLRW
jgi:hypothetical protein